MERGASFAELMLAVLVIATTIVASNASMRTSTEVYHYFADGEHEALMLAQEIHEAALLLPWDSQPGDPPLFGPDVYELMDMDNQEYQPPRSAQYAIVTSQLNWKQVVDVRIVDIDEPSVEVDPNTFLGETLTELKVTIQSGTSKVGEFSWWMTDPQSN